MNLRRGERLGKGLTNKDRSVEKRPQHPKILAQTTKVLPMNHFRNEKFIHPLIARNM